MAQEQTIVLDEDIHYTIIQRKSRHHPPVISKDAGGRPNETEDVAYWRFEAIGKPGEE